VLNIYINQHIFASFYLCTTNNQKATLKSATWPDEFWAFNFQLRRG